MHQIKLESIRNGTIGNNYYIVGKKENFCHKSLLSKRKDCLDFYDSVLSAVCDLSVCPYGYCCYKPSVSSEVILSSIVCSKSNLKAIRNRYKHNNAGERPETIDLENLKLSFFVYDNNVRFISMCNNACHDLNNALNYLVELLEIINPIENKEINDYYQQTINKVKQLQEITIIDNFDMGKQYSEDIPQKVVMNELWEIIDRAYKFCERKIKQMDDCADENLIGAYSGFSLLRTLLRRNIIAFDAIELPEKRTEFSIHKIVKKVVLLLKYKAEMKNVSFPPFEGSPKRKINGFFDSVFTVIFTVIDNAIKYSNMGDTISISFVEDDENKTILRIANRSKPLTKYDLEHIHDKRYRGSNRTQKGHGLGLYLVDNICKKIRINNSADYSDNMFIYTFVFK